MERADIFVFEVMMLNKKNVGWAIVACLILLSALLLTIKHFNFSTALCLLYNCLAIIGVLIWNSSIPVSEVRWRAVSGLLWYGLLWWALWASLEALIT